MRCQRCSTRGLPVLAPSGKSPADRSLALRYHTSSYRQSLPASCWPEGMIDRFKTPSPTVSEPPLQKLCVVREAYVYSISHEPIFTCPEARGSSFPSSGTYLQPLQIQPKFNNPNCRPLAIKSTLGRNSGVVPPALRFALFVSLPPPQAVCRLLQPPTGPQSSDDCAEEVSMIGSASSRSSAVQWVS